LLLSNICFCQKKHHWSYKREA